MSEKLAGLSMDVEAAERDKLLNLCGEYIDESFEKYKFEWKGKADCFRVMGQHSTGTLRPAPDESVDFDTTQNLYIEGDNLEVLKLLQTSYYRKVECAEEAFEDSNVMSNAHYILKDRGIEMKLL